MANDIYRNRIKALIETAISEYKNAKALNHSGFQGRVREIALNNLFKPLLVDGISIGTGKVINKDGNLSRETDLILYSKRILPPMIYNNFDGLYPLESCLYTIEIKSTSTATNIKDAISKSKDLNKLRYVQDYYNKGIHGIIPIYFAFSSDLKSTKTEISKYLECDPDGLANPAIKAICVVGKGYWYHSGSDYWLFRSPSIEKDEVIDFLSGTLNTAPKILNSRTLVSIGEYLMSDRGPEESCHM